MAKTGDELDFKFAKSHVSSVLGLQKHRESPAFGVPTNQSATHCFVPRIPPVLSKRLGSRRGEMGLTTPALSTFGGCITSGDNFGRTSIPTRDGQSDLDKGFGVKTIEVCGCE